MDSQTTEPKAQSLEAATENPAPTNDAPAAAPIDTPSQPAAAATESQEAAQPAPAHTTKRVHSLVLDANAIIKNEPSVSTLINQAEELYTIPAVVSEIRDEAARSRLQTTLAPFLKLRNPRPDSIQFITGFARRTGDLQVLSKPDIHLLALTYELEIERNGGDWRLRNEPNQKRVNGKPPGRAEDGEAEQPAEGAAAEKQEEAADAVEPTEEETKEEKTAETEAAVTEQLESLDLNQEPQQAESTTVEETKESISEEEDDDSDGEWITPSNIKKVQARENASTAPQPAQRVLQAALITSDMAMRNVALRINLNLLDPAFSRITFLKTWVLRCHGCWKVCKDTSKQFCPSCGQATLTRVSCTTDASGNFTLHLKKNFQYNTRGNVYSIPKPTHGSASHKNSNVKGGGKNGWGRELILAEDQKEYVQKQEEERRTKYKDLMDEDYLPSILTGARQGGNGRIKVGAGRNVNAKKRR